MNWKVSRSKVCVTKYRRPPYLHNGINGLLLMGLCGLVGVIFKTGGVQDFGFKEVTCLVAISIIQLYFQSLQHEATHYHLFTSKVWNDFFGQSLLSLPLFNNLEVYRRYHFFHHRYLLNSERDPEIFSYARQGYHFEALDRSRWFKLALLDISGWHWFQFHAPILIDRQFYSCRHLPSKMGLLSFLAGVILLVMNLANEGRLIALWYYWILPQITLTFTLGKWQGFAEHPQRTGEFATSTYNNKQNLFMCLILWPLNGDCHWAHHRMPHLPWYLLREVSVDPRAPVVEGFWSSVRSLRKRLIE